MRFYWPLIAIKRKGPFQSSRGRVKNKKSGKLATLPSVPTPVPSPNLPAATQEVVSDLETPLTPTDEPPTTPLVSMPDEPEKTVQTPTCSLAIPDLATPPPTPLAPKQAVRRKYKGWVYVEDSDPRAATSEEALPNKRQRKASRVFDM